MAHDPGPWTIEEYGDDECPSLVIHKDTESRICFMATPGSQGDPEAITANAKLIAAAPDLETSARDLLDILRDNGALDELDERVRRARKLLASLE